MERERAAGKGTVGLAGSMELVVTIGLAAVGEVDGVSVSHLPRPGARAQTLTANAEAFRRLDEHQYESGEGPAAVTMRWGREATFPDPEGLWTDFTAHATAAGVSAVWSLPLLVRGGVVGSLNLYTTGGDGPTGPAIERARNLATMAQVVLAGASAEEQSDHLRAAVMTRDVIGQAKGILMARQNISSEEAFVALLRASQRSHRKLVDVARGVVERQERPPTPDRERHWTSR